MIDSKEKKIHYFNLNKEIKSLEIIFKEEMELLIDKFMTDEGFDMNSQRYFAKFLQDFPSKVKKQAKAFSKHLEEESKK